MNTTHRRLSAGAVAVTIGILGCGTSNEPGPLATVITYGAVMWTITEAGVETDALAAGATLDLELTEDNRVSGTLFMPAAINNGVDLTADMSGTYTIVQGILRFTQTADTFVRDVAWNVDGRMLTADEAVDGTDVLVELRAL